MDRATIVEATIVEANFRAQVLRRLPGPGSRAMQAAGEGEAVCLEFYGAAGRLWPTQPGPRTARPGVAPVGLASAMTGMPLTSTWRIPVAY